MKKSTLITATLLFAAVLFLTSCTEDKVERTFFDGVWTLTHISMSDGSEHIEETYDYTNPEPYFDVPGIMTLKSVGTNKYAFYVFEYNDEENIWERYFNGNVVIRDNKLMVEDDDEYFISITNITYDSFTLEDAVESTDIDYDFSMSLKFKKLSGNADEVAKFIKYTDAGDLEKPRPEF